MPALPQNLRPGLVALFLILLSTAVFGQVRESKFLNLDDDKNVVENPYVRQGLHAGSLRVAFSAGLSFDFSHVASVSEWIPVTVLSRMADVELFGLNPAGHHLMNLVFHILNAILLFYLLNTLTGCFWRSALVASLFAVHPLQVEAVSWVTSRKDLLSTFFGLLTVNAYLRSLRQGGAGWRIGTLVLFCLAMMSKPTIVMLPLILVLLDFWPLKRWGRGSSRGFWHAVSTKVELFVVALIFGAVALGAEHGLLGEVSWTTRLLRSFPLYVFYLSKAMAPFQLTLYGPAPTVPMGYGSMIGSGFLMLAATTLLVRLRQSHPYLLVGWLWCLVALAPVIGLPTPADRYMYFPIAGLLVLGVWGASILSERWHFRKGWASVMSGILLLMFAALSTSQTAHWKNNRSLYEHVLTLRETNYLAHNNLGLELARSGDWESARNHYTRAIYHYPDYATAHLNLGVLLQRRGDREGAVRHYSRVLESEPRSAEALYNLGILSFEEGRDEKAFQYISEALAITPNFVAARHALAKVLAHQGRYDEALRHYAEILLIDPEHEEALRGRERLRIQKDSRPLQEDPSPR